MNMNRPKWHRVLMAAALVSGGALVGASLSPTNEARAEMDVTPAPPAFQAGGVPILKDIAATLRQMDARLARLELTAQKMQAGGAGRSLSGRNAGTN